MRLVTSKAGIDLIQSFEGCRLQAYLDGAGIPTIGFGHTKDVNIGDHENLACAEKDLTADLAQVEAAVNSAVTVWVNQNQFDALVSFTFNLGPVALRESSLLRFLNEQRYDLAALEFPKWDQVAGEPSQGLLRRRMAEQVLFELPVLTV